jgi:cysteine desulfurase
VGAPIYLDHHATTPLDPRVLERFLEVARDHFGNPASASHAYGWAAARLVESAREEVAALIGAAAREIVFTSGATEADNLALVGFAEAWGGAGRHVVTTDLEHPAVSAPLARLEAQGWQVTRVRAGTTGVVAAADVAAAITPQTALVSLIAVQNELGTVQPLAAVGALCKARGVILHTDAAQAAGKIPLDVARDGVDLLAFSAHKLYGPKGVGALYVRRRDPRVTLAPQMLGGGQERGLRSGTLNVPAIVAFGLACRLAQEEMAADTARVGSLRDRLWQRLQAGLPGVVRLNGDPHRRVAGNLHVTFAGLPPGRLLPALTTLAVSVGSACSSEEPGTSPALAAIGAAPEDAQRSLRLGLGRFTTQVQTDQAAALIVEVVRQLREEAAAGPAAAS